MCYTFHRAKRYREERKVKRIINEERQLTKFGAYLEEEEKALETCRKYLRDVRGFLSCSKGKVSKETVVRYKKSLEDKGYCPRSINSKLAGVRAFLHFLGIESIRVKNLKVQQAAYVSEKRMLRRSDYEKLLHAADDMKERLILESIFATGIRVSELKYFTAEAIEKGEVMISLKGKSRRILLVGKLRKKLSRYAREEQIVEGQIFLNRKRRPLHRSQVWQMMKRLAKKAGVDPRKVFPHNLRRLFARIFYNAGKDIAKLADILGHSSINTTRIYIATTAAEHIRVLERLRLVT